MKLPKISSLILCLLLSAEAASFFYSSAQTNSPTLKTPPLARRRLLSPEEALKDYRDNLRKLRKEFGGMRTLPDVKFFLFGMGGRPKLLYQNGALRNALTGETLKQWDVESEIIVPPDYAVFLTTRDGNKIKIVEDEQALWIQEGLHKFILSQSPIQLPVFFGHRYAPVLRVLHQEVLINIIQGKPVPNYFVYKKPWYCDGSSMCMVLKETGNLDLVRDWILGLRELFDRNNGGETEPDNLGELLFLISLVSDQSHPLVPKILETLPKFAEGKHLAGRRDFSAHPVYITKWAKFGLKSLQLPDPYEIPSMKDTYSALFWWDFKDQHVDSGRFGINDNQNWPYLVWAEGHFYSEKKGWVSNQDYPLSWESNASQADYQGMKILGQVYVDQKLSVPHTWHAAEMFLYLLNK
jgi:hypothetical protein